MSYYDQNEPCCGKCAYFNKYSRNVSRSFAAQGGGECMHRQVVAIRRLPSYKPFNSRCFESSEFVHK